MIWVLLQSESPWERNDAITFFYLSLCFSVPEMFLRNRLSDFVPTIIASIMEAPYISGFLSLRMFRIIYAGVAPGLSGHLLI